MIFEDLIRRWRMKRIDKKLDELIKERNKWLNHWCGTPRLLIEEEIINYHNLLAQHHSALRNKIFYLGELRRELECVSPKNKNGGKD